MMRFTSSVFLLTNLYLIAAQTQNRTYSGTFPNLYSTVSLQTTARNCSFNTTSSLQSFSPRATIRNHQLICIESALNCSQNGFDVSCTDQRTLWLSFTGVTFPGVMGQLDPAEPITGASFRVCQLGRDLAYCKVSIGRSNRPRQLLVQVKFTEEARLEDDCRDFRRLLRNELKSCGDHVQQQNKGVRSFAGLVFWVLVFAFCLFS